MIESPTSAAVTMTGRYHPRVHAPLAEGPDEEPQAHRRRMDLERSDDQRRPADHGAGTSRRDRGQQQPAI